MSYPLFQQLKGKAFRLSVEGHEFDLWRTATEDWDGVEIEIEGPVGVDSTIMGGTQLLSFAIPMDTFREWMKRAEDLIS